MKKNTHTWLLAVGMAALLALTALAYHLYPGLIEILGIDLGDLGGLALAAAILWLLLRRTQALSPRARIVLGVSVAVALLLGLAVFFIS